MPGVNRQFDFDNLETVETASPATPSQPNFRGRWWIRIALFVVHIVIVLGASFFFTPAQYAFQFGYSYGQILLCSSILLWFLLLVAQTRRGVLVFCGLVLAQAGLVVLAGLQFQASDRALQSLKEELEKDRTMKIAEWTKMMEPYRMDALFDMTSGKRELSLTELQELQRRARDGRAKMSELKSDWPRFMADEERRVAAVDSQAARGFRLGVENSQQAWDELMKLSQDSFTESEELVVFLIDRYGQYAQTSKGLKFKKVEDAQYFNSQLKAIASLQQRLASINRLAKEQIGAESREVR